MKKSVGMKKTVKNIAKLETLNSKLRDQNHLLKVQNEMREKGVQNSLASLSGPWGGQTNPYSMAPITGPDALIKNNVYYPISLMWVQLEYMYKSHGLIQSLVNMPVRDALSGWIDLKSNTLERKQIWKLADVCTKKGIQEVITDAGSWGGLYGGSGIVISTEQKMDTPLDLDLLANDKRIEFYACSRWELVSPWRDSEYYNFYGEKIHNSRVLTLCGQTAPFQIRWMLSGWGLSEIERVYEDFQTYIRVKNMIYALLWEAKVDVFKFENFASQMLSPDAELKTNARMSLMNSQKNYNSAMLMDKMDEFEQKQINFSGIAEIYRESRIELAASYQFPMTKLFGLPSTGFSTNQDDRETYNAGIEARNRPQLRAPILKILRLLSIAMYQDDSSIDFSFKPLRLVTATEEESIKTSKLNRLLSLFNNGIISNDQMSELLISEGIYSSSIDINRFSDDISAERPHIEQIDTIDMPEKLWGMGNFKNPAPNPHTRNG